MSGAMVADAARMGPRYAKRLLEGIPDERFARFSTPGGQTVTANHPAFVLGHLCLYPVKVLELLGMDPARAKPPENYEDLFSKNATCQDDPDGTLYPSREELVAVFEQTYASAIDALAAASEEQLNSENPVGPPMSDVFPTLGGMLTFYLTGHVMTHMGQLSTWRRMEGLPPA